MPTQKPSLRLLIESSLLLGTEHRKSLLHVLPTLNDEQQRTLRELLEDGENRTDAGIARAIREAVERFDETALKAVDDFLVTSRKALNRTTEEVERTDEDQNADILIDNAT